MQTRHNVVSLLENSMPETMFCLFLETLRSEDSEDFAKELEGKSFAQTWMQHRPPASSKLEESRVVSDEMKQRPTSSRIT